jgi:hypothetical protein
MATKNAPSEDLGTCDNHPDTPAVHATDGVKFEVKRFCKTCLDRWHKALVGPRRG